MNDECIFKVRREYHKETGRATFEHAEILDYVRWLEKRVADDYFIPVSKPAPSLRKDKNTRKLFMVVQIHREKLQLIDELDFITESVFNVISKGHTTGYSALMEIASRQNSENYVIMKYWEVSR